MRSFDPTEESDRKDAERIGAEPWMLELLSLNPEYVHWSPGEDYMKPSKKDGGWDAGCEVATWKEFGWKLDELNECVHFYFQVYRSSERCACEGGYNAATKKIEEDFYGAGYQNGWRDKLTQDEVDKLCEEGRLNWQFKYQEWDEIQKQWRRIGPNPTAETVNAAERAHHVHDAINRHILVQARATRLGVYGLCERCDGHAYVYTEPKPHASLVLWMLHPRKGCSRGVEIKHLDREDLPKVCAWLKEAAERNAERFAKIMPLAAK